MQRLCVVDPNKNIQVHIRVWTDLARVESKVILDGCKALGWGCISPCNALNTRLSIEICGRPLYDYTHQTEAAYVIGILESYRIEA